MALRRSAISSTDAYSRAGSDQRRSASVIHWEADAAWSSTIIISGGGPRPSMLTTRSTWSGRPGRHRHGEPAAERVADQPHGWAECWRDLGEVELVHLPVGAAGVQPAAVAVAAHVDGDRVVAEGGDPRGDAVPHAPVVPSAVDQQHRRLGGVAPLPQADGGAAEVEQLGPVGLGQLQRV